MSRRTKLLIALPFVLVLLVVGGTWAYLHLVEGDAPSALTLTTRTGAPTTGPATTTTAGSWTVTDETQVGYRVGEVLFGQSATAVGRTNKVTGNVTLSGADVTAATFTVDMASVTTDRSRRDGQYRDRIMSTGQFPTSTFALTSPIELGSLPADGATVEAKATGDLTLRGVTKTVTFDVSARRSGTRMEISGAIPIAFDEWGIPSPSFGPAQVEDHGTVEFLLVLAPAGS
jgi:polyisoprenoid-binding protein YceI